MIDPIIKYLNGRAKTQLYGLFIFWVLVFHVDLIFAALFVDQELVYKATDQLKDQYIQSRYLHFHEWSFWVIEMAKFLAALLFTYLMIWVLPQAIVVKAYEKELDADYVRREKKLAKDQALERQKQDLSKERLVSVQKEEEVFEKQDDLVSKELQGWITEFQNFDPDVLTQALDEISDAITRHAGRIKRYYDEDEEAWRKPSISSDSVMLAYSSGIVDLDEENEKVSLTPKGRFFVSRTYQLRK